MVNNSQRGFLRRHAGISRDGRANYVDGIESYLGIL